MRKQISTKVHGVLDYVTGAALMALPSVLGWRRRPSMLLEGAGGDAKNWIHSNGSYAQTRHYPATRSTRAT